VRKGELLLVRCARCSFIQQDPIPSEEELSQFYHVSRGYEEEILHAEDTFLQRDREILQQLMNLGAEGPLLDIGCSAGTLLRTARELDWEVEGIEISKPCAKALREKLGVKVHEKPIEKLRLGSDRFGVVTLSNTLEHVPDPVGTLQKTTEVLRPGGIIFISVPNWKAGKRKLIGKEISWIYPHHISYFTRKSLNRALKKAGLRPLFWRHVPFLGVDYPFFIGMIRRLGLDGCVRAFLGLKEYSLEDLISDHVKLQCAFWRFKLVFHSAKGFLRIWPERLLCRLGLGEELRVIAKMQNNSA
jgi:2-polyprenyl-3-methyl-5-hydroxy-6-metoxy-1,4-benzoquinol methylase